MWVVHAVEDGGGEGHACIGLSVSSAFAIAGFPAGCKRTPCVAHSARGRACAKLHRRGNRIGETEHWRFRCSSCRRETERGWMFNQWNRTAKVERDLHQTRSAGSAKAYATLHCFRQGLLATIAHAVSSAGAAFCYLRSVKPKPLQILAPCGKPYRIRGGNEKPCVFPRSRLRFTLKAG